MGSIVSGLFGGGGGGSSANNNAGSISGLSNLAGTQTGLGNQLLSLGNSIYGPAFNQYQAGATGQLTPSQSAMVSQNLGATNTATEGLYGGLGLGGSTMEGQDLNANALRSMAEEANLQAQSESLGLQGLQQGLGYYGTAGQEYGGAGTDLARAGQLQTENTAALNSAINSLGNKSAGGLGSGISSLIGGATGTAGTGAALGSLFGGGGGAGAASIGTDLAPVFLAA